MQLISNVFELNRAIPWSKNRQTAIAKALALLFALNMLAACQPASTINVEDLIGIWTVAGGFTQFNEDGTYVVAISADKLTSQRHEYGDFRLEGTTLIFIPEEESFFCAGEMGNYEVEMADRGYIEITLAEDPCEHRSRIWRNVFFRPYSP